ncbi:hypothetical protein ACOSP7_025797 [Xanthoceras sorbifolium]|uniref:Uncharacterized protein n=1 Tax=Xanthoceras sorbifolium TaxID=99658 RepID=A0ABQ8H675_9ROSI|nr:hypothetical protein JRO89_XS13G0029800 [Xanthoceras sorbifolium]
MGNATSCTPSLISNGVVKVLFSDGTLQVYTKPLKAAELMLENPGKFVCDSSSLRVGHRIQGLSADEELERRKIYFVLHMELLYSVLTHEEMSSLSYKATRALKKHASYSNNLGKIFPEFCLFPSEAAKRVQMIDSSPAENGDGSVEREVRLYSKQRSWKPALETIAETPFRL